MKATKSQVKIMTRRVFELFTYGCPITTYIQDVSAPQVNILKVPCKESIPAIIHPLMYCSRSVADIYDLSLVGEASKILNRFNIEGNQILPLCVALDSATETNLREAACLLIDGERTHGPT